MGDLYALNAIVGEAPARQAEEMIRVVAAALEPSQTGPYGDLCLNAERAAVKAVRALLVAGHLTGRTSPRVTGPPEGGDTLADWLEYRGLPPSTTLSELIAAERDTARLAGVFDHIAEGRRKDPPSVYALPAEPGPEVTELWDREGERWAHLPATPVGDDWAPGDQAADEDPAGAIPWDQLVYEYGPLSTKPPQADPEPVMDRCLNCNAPLVRRGGKLVHRDGDPDRCTPPTGTEN